MKIKSVSPKLKLSNKKLSTKLFEPYKKSLSFCTTAKFKSKSHVSLPHKIKGQNEIINLRKGIG